ncbi:MAG: hypothetical protein K8T25_04925 [Planctomycetia bacterium]|nr:hypothetical protein [Planctomycetia bacterium]
MPSLSIRALAVLLLGVAIVWQKSTAEAAPPLANLVRFERIDADPKNAYPLTERQGPWLIMVTTFQVPPLEKDTRSGTAAQKADRLQHQVEEHARRKQQAEDDARKLVYELRKRYKLTAYTHQMTFDYSDAVVGRGLDQMGNRQRMRYNQGGKPEEVAVLVGDFNSVDDPQLDRVLKKIKLLRPESLGGDGGSHSQVFESVRQSLMSEENKQKKPGPLRLAFVTTNPLLPENYYHPKGIDQFVRKLNQPFEYSLLNCPGRYTVRIATFEGNVIIDANKIKEIESTKESDVMQHRLQKAGQKAHETTVYLRASGYEAYEYHDRNSSIVTVGSFDSPGYQTTYGGFKYSPPVQKVVDSFKAKLSKLGGPLVPERIPSINVVFDPQPIVIEAPKQSIGSDYTQGAAEGR